MTTGPAALRTALPLSGGLTTALPGVRVTAFSRSPPMLRRIVPKASRHTFRYDYISGLLEGVYFGAVLMAAFVAKGPLDATAFEITMMITAATAGLLFSVYWAHLMEGKPKVPFVTWPGGIGRGLLIGCALVSSSVPFTVLISISLLIVQMIIPAKSAVWRANYPTATRARIVGIIRSSIILVASLTMLAIGRLAITWPASYRILYPFAGICGIASAIVFSRIKVSEGKSLGPWARNRFSLARLAKVLRRDRPYAQFMSAVFIFGFANLMTVPLLVLVVDDDLEATTFEASVMMSIGLGMVIVFTPFLGRVVDRRNPASARALFTIIWSFSPLLVFLARDMSLVYVSQAVQGFAMGGSALIWLLGAMYFARTEDVPKYQGIHATLTGIRGLIAPSVALLLARWFGSNQKVFLVSWVMMIAAAVWFHFQGQAEEKRQRLRKAATPRR